METADDVQVGLNAPNIAEKWEGRTENDDPVVAVGVDDNAWDGNPIEMSMQRVGQQPQCPRGLDGVRRTPVPMLSVHAASPVSAERR
eukprot:CAMPEP_0182528576 /NCGR_PEP_ID=MMETSP1323-20130603/4596_1 /TAXON_ID=236787 /ORGANISM="Florenciella parvula, Strain RCC1693" /LENGTH=86 /DNA_ID=CAMNT_0024737705 /DNA_START=853 /DNA_END=1110 /DNA_ORIENTATION=+